MSSTPAPSVASQWLLSGVMLLGVGAAAAGLGSLFDGIEWWFVIMAVALVVFTAGATVRSFVRWRLWPSLAVVVTAFAVITVMFAPAQSILGVIPTPDTFERFRELERAGAASISTQAIPANADTGILYLLCLGVAVIAFVMDWIAFMLRAPAITGVPLLVLLLVPSLVRAELENGFFFALTALAWAAILLVRSKRSGRRVAIGIAAVAVTAGLVVPLVLPPLEQSSQGGTSAAGFSAGINPIITLGDDLRRGDPTFALRYTSTEEAGQYLRLTALDDFSGTSWTSSNSESIDGNFVDAIGAAPGLGPDVPVIATSTRIKVGNILSRWLPTPYAPTSVSGLVGTWTWEPEALSIRTERSSARGQEYTVESLQIAPSIGQLVAAGTTVDSGLDRYLVVPDDLPAIVGSTALEVTAGAATNYDKAVALQDYFQGEDFVYSEDAPVENGYDGSGARVLGAFLDAKSGYCVHFSSAMASMARTLGIPARIVVGFTPGQGELQDDDSTEYTVTTYNLHAWPELYFTGIGWVRFEPTPGRGVVPEFAPLAIDDPATPDVDESVPVVEPTTAPTTAPSLPPVDDPTTNDPQSVGPTTTSATAPWWVLIVAVLVALVIAPGALRVMRRSQRFRQVSNGSASAAWAEVRDTADDLGVKTDGGRTPRQLSDDLARHLTSTGVDALARLRGALESEAFAEHEGKPDPADVRVVIRSLRESAGLRSSVIAAFAPRSLVARWLPEAVRT